MKANAASSAMTMLGGACGGGVCGGCLKRGRGRERATTLERVSEREYGGV